MSKFKCLLLISLSDVTSWTSREIAMAVGMASSALMNAFLGAMAAVIGWRGLRQALTRAPNASDNPEAYDADQSGSSSSGDIALQEVQKPGKKSKKQDKQDKKHRRETPKKKNYKGVKATDV